MDLLLDTNALLWAMAADERLREQARDAIRDPANRVFVSVVSVWEIAIKLALGKLHVASNVVEWLPREMAASRFTPLPVLFGHAASVEHLPMHHRDPFDRLLIAQAIAERLTIVTSDPEFLQYAVPVIRS